MLSSVHAMNSFFCWVVVTCRRGRGRKGNVQGVEEGDVVSRSMGQVGSRAALFRARGTYIYLFIFMRKSFSCYKFFALRGFAVTLKYRLFCVWEGGFIVLRNREGGKVLFALRVSFPYVVMTAERRA